MGLRGIPWLRFGVLTAIAVGGSAFYGGSLAVALPGWDLWKGAAWLTLSAGAGWLFFIPSLWLASRRVAFLQIFDACLVAMAVGEGVLAVGAIANMLRLTSGVPFNALVVAASNVAMVSVLAVRLRGAGVDPRTTVALWCLVLDGVGALAFWSFYRVLFGGSI